MVVEYGCSMIVIDYEISNWRLILQRSLSEFRVLGLSICAKHSLHRSALYSHQLIYLLLYLFKVKRFLIECRKNKTKVITLANHKGHRQYCEPIKTQNNHSSQSQSTQTILWTNQNQSNHSSQSKKTQTIQWANQNQSYHSSQSQRHRQYSEPIKTNVITLANHKRQRQYCEPIKTKVITLVNHKPHRQHCEPIKTNAITLANHKRHRQYSEPIKTQSNHSSQSQKTQTIQWANQNSKQSL